MNLKSPIPLSFTTERFIIRRYKKKDEDLLYDAARASIPEVFRFLPWCHPDYDRTDARQWLDSVSSNWKEANGYSFAIFSKDEQEFHGGCGINRIDEHPIANLGYWIKTESIGTGIATEATRHLAKFALKVIGLQRLEILMSVENLASKGVAEASGAVYEGMLRNRLMLHGKVHDAYLYSMTPADLKD